MISRTRLCVLAFCLSSVAFSAQAQERLLTIDDIYDPVKRINFNGSPPLNLAWLEDGEYYLQSEPAKDGAARIWRVRAATGERELFFDGAKMEAALRRVPGIDAEGARRLASQSSYNFNPARTAVLLDYANDLFYYELGSDRVVRLTATPEEETDATFSPDGRLVAFVRAGNLYVVEVATGRERALTTDGSDELLNGRLDWVYEEELYGRGNTRGYWWSPDSARIAYLQLDERRVPRFTVVDHIPRLQALEQTHYPLAGDPNPLVKLGVVSAAGGPTRWAELSSYLPEDLLISRVAWSPDARRVLFQAQNREQTFLDLNAADAETGRTTRLFREQTRAWIEAVDNPRWLRDGSFLWRSERSGWMHLYHYAPDGKLIRQVTDGEWEVRDLYGVDEKAGFIYFAATEHSHIAEHVYRIKLDGSQMMRLTQAEGWHRAAFNPQFTRFIDYWSDVQTPTQVWLFDADGKQVRVIDENRVEALRQFKLGKPEFLQVKTRDGFVMEAMMIKPPDFDPKRKYPVMSYTYSGPHAPAVRNAWGGPTYMWHQLLAQRGYIIWICDNRTASGKGAQSAWAAYGNFGELELRDLEDGISYLRSLPYVDAERIGLWGWSFGGYMTSYALTHSRSFRIGIAGAPVTDWHLYDSIYTERYMRMPQNNAEGYRRSSVVRAASDLHGKLLLIHGTMDDNVHLQNSIQFAYELQKAGKQFQLMLYPKSRHGVSDPLLVKHLRQMMTDFILANL